MTVQPLQPIGQRSVDGLFPIVGIGASAGGLEAFTQLLHHLPCDTGMAFVLVQHLDPKHESRLGPLLAKATSMPVIEATDGLAILPDHVYIIPPDTTLTVKEGILRLTPRGETRGLHLPIDRLFDSLSADRRTAAIGVVLSGSGADGTLGLERIKSEGGITFAQDEPSAKFPSMPRSATRSGSVDFVLSPEAIALELVRIGRHAYLSPGQDTNGPGEDDLFRKVLRLLREATGVDFREYRETTIRRRILRRMVLHNRKELADYVRLLEEDRSEIDALFEDILINVTRFFREPEVFEELKRTVFPEILKGRTSAAPIRIWVPGCSTGQEAYSLAMALLEYLEESSSHVPLQIFATDLSDA
ncbi:MAG TPA: chemotaxis protein CheB, partial [Thermoanaerobaculia bacterium]